MLLTVSGILAIARIDRLRRPRRPGTLAGIGYGLVTGGFIASYTLVDAYAVKTLLIAPLVVDYLSGHVPAARRRHGAAPAGRRVHRGRHDPAGVARLTQRDLLRIPTRPKQHTWQNAFEATRPGTGSRAGVRRSRRRGGRDGHPATDASCDRRTPCACSGRSRRSIVDDASRQAGRGSQGLARQAVTGRPPVRCRCVLPARAARPVRLHGDRPGHRADRRARAGLTAPPPETAPAPAAP